MVSDPPFSNFEESMMTGAERISADVRGLGFSLNGDYQCSTYWIQHESLLEPLIHDGMPSEAYYQREYSAVTSFFEAL